MYMNYHAFIYIHTYIQTHIHKIHTYIHTHTHTHTHTHILPSPIKRLVCGCHTAVLIEGWIYRHVNAVVCMSG